MTDPYDYNGLTLLYPHPSGQGGGYIQDNFKNLVDWNPKSSTDPTTGPGSGTDERFDYQPLSLWLNTDASSPQLWVCRDASTLAADWRPVLLKVAQDTAPTLGGSLNANSNTITNVARLGIGGAVDSTIPLVVTGAASNSNSFFKLTTGTVSSGFFIGTGGNVQFGTITNHPVILYANNQTVLQFDTGTILSYTNISFNGVSNTLGKVTNYGTVNTAGNGLAAIVAQSRVTGQTGAKSSLVTFTPSADGTFVIQANILVTTATNHSFTMTVTYTDEGNTARTVTMPFVLVASPSTITTSVVSANGAVPYMGLPLTIRAKASTAITAQTTGTFTSVVYNAEAVFSKLA